MFGEHVKATSEKGMKRREKPVCRVWVCRKTEKRRGKGT